MSLLPLVLDRALLVAFLVYDQSRILLLSAGSCRGSVDGFRSRSGRLHSLPLSSRMAIYDMESMYG